MANNKIDELRKYAHLIEVESGHAVRPYRADGFVNVINKYGTQKDVTEHYNFQPEAIADDVTIETFYEGNGLFAKIIDAPAEEALKNGFELEDVKDSRILSFMEDALDELDWEEVAITCIKWARLFGGCLAVMLINDGGGLEDPVNWKNIRSIDEIRVFDRSCVQPYFPSQAGYEADDPYYTRGSRMGMPEYFDVFSRHGNFRVHDSRCLVFQNGVLPERCSDTLYEFWGIPEYVRIRRAIRDAEVAHGSAPKLLDRSVMAIYKMQGLAQTLAMEGGEEMVLKRLQTIDLAKGLLNSIAIDGEGEDYDYRSFSYAGASDVINTTCNYLSALTNIPQTILFGRSPAGMNATGNGDLENWYNFVGRIQKRMVKKNLRYLLSILFQAGVHTGEIDEIPAIKVKFSPLWSLSEQETVALEQQKAAISQTKAATAQIYQSIGVLTVDEIRKGLADSDEFEVDTLLDEYTEEELKENLENAPAPQGDPAASPEASLMPNAQGGPEQALGDEGEEIPTEDAEMRSGASDEPQEYAGVGVIVFKDGKILAGKRYNTSDYGKLCGPGGHIEAGESPEQTAFRETEEEFGITPKKLVDLGEVESADGEFTRLYVCNDFEGEVYCLDGEMTNPNFYEFKDLAGMELFEPFRRSLKVLLDALKEVKETGEFHKNILTQIDKHDTINVDGDEGWVTTANGNRILISDGEVIGGNAHVMMATYGVKDRVINGKSAFGANTHLPGFNKWNLERHWNGGVNPNGTEIHPHKDEFKGMSMKEYGQRALELIRQPVGGDILGHVSDKGQVYRFNKATGEFVVGNEKGVASFFKVHYQEPYEPEKAIGYYKFQIKRFGG